MKSLITATALAAITALATTTSAFAKPADEKGEKPPKFSQKNDVTILELATQLSGEDGVDDNPGDFDILIAALGATGVIAAFDGMTDYTVFAPTDGAFIALAEALDGVDVELDEATAAGIVLGLGSDYVTDVLLYHVTEGVRNSRSVTRAKAVNTLLEGETLSVDGGVVYATKSEAELVDFDNRLIDGMVHVIDGVLVPFLPPQD